MQSNDELKRRLAAVDCQLRKEQKAVRRYEVATEKLLQFVEVTILCIIFETLPTVVSHLRLSLHRTVMKHS